MNSASVPAKVAILIAVYNGGRHLAEVLGGLKGHPVEVWVSDDGSTDGSPELAREMGATVLVSDKRTGKGGALRRGIEGMLQDAPDLDWVIFMDGDGQHLPEEIPRFLAAMTEERELIVGSRMEEAEDIPAYRRITNQIGSLILAWISGAYIPDTQCGYRAVRVNLLRRLSLESFGFEIETEMLLRSVQRGARLGVVPVTPVYGGQGSHFRPVHDTFRICMAGLRYAR